LRAQTGFLIGNVKLGVRRHLATRGEALFHIFGGVRLERVLRAHQPPDMVEAKAAQSRERHHAVTGVGRVKAAAKQTNGRAGREIFRFGCRMLGHDDNAPPIWAAFGRRRARHI
jgi:hypothetical protein